MAAGPESPSAKKIRLSILYSCLGRLGNGKWQKSRGRRPKKRPEEGCQPCQGSRAQGQGRLQGWQAQGARGRAKAAERAARQGVLESRGGKV